MAYDYDKLYRETPDALGAPTPAFTAFFEGLGAQSLHMPAAPQPRKLLIR
ncbi:hypothetical protein [Leisingera sp. ANG-M7]|nr:hypothetical protein [Leisingera sp. ANG-M7]